MAHERSRKFTNRSLGAFGEQVVVDYLIHRGSEIVDRNWRIKEGEIDIVAKQMDGIIAFVEVKTRSSLAYGHPLESITREKAHRLQKLALAWLVTHGSFGETFSIDCAAVLLNSIGQPTIEYRANVL